MFFTKNETFGVASANCLNAIYRQLALFERSGGGNCEAISDGAERVLNFLILYTHPHTHTPTHPPIHTYSLHKTLLSTYMRRS
jgi:hypothetical protein